MIHTDLIASIPDLLARQSQNRGDKVAYRDKHRSVTYAALNQRTADLAGHLADQGLEVGGRVAIWLPNSVNWIESCLATARAHGIAVPISYEATTSEAIYRLDDADCRTLITTADKVTALEESYDNFGKLANIITVDPGDNHYDDLVATAPSTPPRDPADIDGCAYIVYTSGTTGQAKGVMLSTRSMLWVTAACWAPIADVSVDDIILSPLPLFHSYALNLSVLSVLAAGATEYIVEKFSPSEVLSLIASEGITVMPGVPTMFHYLLQTAKDDGIKSFPKLRLMISAGAIMPATLNQEFEDWFGVPLLDGYGITETATMVTMNWLTGQREPGSCGLPLPGLATRIVDAGTGLDVEAGAEGEIIVRGPNLMLGYHNKPEATAAAIRDGWYHTGDLARYDAAGFVTITGRLKELIIRGGQNIAPAEIEETVMTFAGVGDCAVVGQPHKELGEVPVVFIVEQADQAVDEAALLAHCRKKLSSYKIPVSVHKTTGIPRTGSGKTMRFKLTETLADAG